MQKLIDTIMLIGEYFKTSQPILGTRQWYSLHSWLLNIKPEVLARAVSQEKKRKLLQMKQELAEVSVYIDDRILHITDPKHST